jgi:hypothetical protein
MSSPHSAFPAQQRNSPPVPAPGGMRRGAYLLSAVCCLLTAACGEYYTLEGKDENFEVPDDLPQRLQRFRSGSEKWHGDPKAVADLALRNSLQLNVPWAPEPYRPSQYQVKESPEWGTFVVRGYVYPSGHLMRYRVKVRAYQEIWYVVQISHYKMHTIDEDDLHPLDH